jgi:hypothetical protein
MNRRTLTTLFVLLAACGSTVSSDEDARNAYLGLDPSIDKAISLGFDGFNSASSANIDPQTADGGVSGTLTVSGHVDQGNSGTSKIMNLTEALTNYSDNGSITYVTNAAALPALSMSLGHSHRDPRRWLNGPHVRCPGRGSRVNLTFTGMLRQDREARSLRQPGTAHHRNATSAAGVQRTHPVIVSAVGLFAAARQGLI